jgi:hypothetical protein
VESLPSSRLVISHIREWDIDGRDSALPAQWKSLHPSIHCITIAEPECVEGIDHVGRFDVYLAANMGKSEVGCDEVCLAFQRPDMHNSLVRKLVSSMMTENIDLVSFYCVLPDHVSYFSG